MKYLIKHGIDVVDDKRFSKDPVNKQIFLQKVFHPTEINSGKLSSIFALKEATFKALGIFPKWLEVEVKYEKNLGTSKPKLILSSAITPKNIISIDSSITHESGFTFASVIILLENKSSVTRKTQIKNNKK
jgi:phosphopantetheinyl transferase (holo-ACP synthase)